MRILLLGLNYLPESTSIGPYTAGLAEFLAKSGCEVTVVTGFPMAPAWRVWEGYRGKVYQRERIKGVDVIRTYLFVPTNPKKAWKRVLFDLSFSVSALVGAAAAGKSDLVVAISPPLQLGLTGWLAARASGAPLFFHIQDLVPDAAVATGMLGESSKAVRIARRIETFVYSRSKGIGVISPGFVRNLLNKGVDAGKVHLLPNFVDLDFIRPTDSNNEFRQRNNFPPECFLVMYSGSVALKQGLETLVQAARFLADREDIRFCLIGDGPYLPELKEQAARAQLTNFEFLPMQPRSELPLQLSAADLLVVSQRKSITDMVFPGKLLYYMAAARPILAAVASDSETGRFISQNSVGIVSPPEEPEKLAASIAYLADNRAEGAAMGVRGRETVERQFDQTVVLNRFLNTFRRTIDGTSPEISQSSP